MRHVEVARVRRQGASGRVQSLAPVSGEDPRGADAQQSRGGVIMSSVRALERRETANSWPHSPRRHRQHDRTGGKEDSPAQELKLERKKKETEEKSAMTGRCEDAASPNHHNLLRSAGLVFHPLSAAACPQRPFGFAERRLN